MVDILNKKFNKLLALNFSHSDFLSTRHPVQWWLFSCDCGSKKLIRKGDVVSGRTKSCGCIRKEFMKKAAVERFTKHGMLAKGSPLADFRTKWIALKSRCNPKIKNYGDRGITFNERWSVFENFKEDMYPSYLIHKEQFGVDTSLDRIDNNLGYSKDNCKWATRNEQNRNQRKTLNITLNGKTQCLSEWTRELGLNYARIYGRIRKGWDPVEALTT